MHGEKYWEIYWIIQENNPGCLLEPKKNDYSRKILIVKDAIKKYQKLMMPQWITLSNIGVGEKQY